MKKRSALAGPLPGLEYSTDIVYLGLRSRTRSSPGYNIPALSGLADVNLECGFDFDGDITRQ
jgi:hypothetical protein